MIAGQTVSDGQGTSMFPFLSLFVCVMGVMALLQVLLAAGGPTMVELQVVTGRSYMTPYTVYCFPSGVVLVPPEASLDRLIAGSQGREKTKLEAIAARRNTLLEEQATSWESALSRARSIDRTGVRDLLDGIKTVNQAATRARVAYEEFLLVGIFPGGSRWYRELRRVVFSKEYRNIAVGAEPLDMSWRLTPHGLELTSP